MNRITQFCAICGICLISSLLMVAVSGCTNGDYDEKAVSQVEKDARTASETRLHKERTESETRIRLAEITTDEEAERTKIKTQEAAAIQKAVTTRYGPKYVSDR